ncbi:unnamed protein product [Bursaphelenchus okinawaensis]|uniref:Beta-1,4-N-acetylgalactosaminyltransferase n=1 Tax=Bursaphelenchus okinawaensis TaxID=465554 RepID=A0A811JT72_9BILA|nr:unnamed protein product [Bursaphelenchus okinawaensis]CAG9081778.1 unnamed protein product [Bursaphelenchus okinawaensis]
MMQCSHKLTIILVVCLIILFVWDLNVDSLVPSYGYLSKTVATDDPAVILLNSADINGTSVLSDVYGNITQFIGQNSSLPDCPVDPPNLVGPIRVWMDAPTYDNINKVYPWLEDGGRGHPDECKARHRVAIIVPYRNREKQLRILLHNLHSLLKKQNIDYAIFIIEQVEKQTFNRAKLMNVGYTVASQMYDWQCFIFHDVDLLPEDDRNVYSCPEKPRHMSVAVDKFGYKLPYGSIFGGVSALTKAQFVKMNGFSNDYWGWGGEDDDMSSRIVYSGYEIFRYPIKIAHYKMIKHSKETENPKNTCRYRLLKLTKKRYLKDGINNLRYKIVNITQPLSHTRVLVDLLENDLRPNLSKELGTKDCRWP